MEPSLKATCPDGVVREFRSRSWQWHGDRGQLCSGYVYAADHRVFGEATNVYTEDGWRLYFEPSDRSKYRDAVLIPVAPSDGVEALDEATAARDVEIATPGLIRHEVERELSGVS